MTYDIFPFLNELDILELRLRELWDVVDRFVIVEFTQTFSGTPKSFIFKEYQLRFAPFFEKIHHIMIDGETQFKTALERETYQRSMMAAQIRPRSSDTIIYGDADEIIDASALAKFDRNPGIARLHMSHHCQLAGWVFDEAVWDNAKIVTGDKYNELAALFGESIADPIRYHHTKDWIDPGGWHFAYSGGRNNMIDKIRSTSHFDHPDVPALIADVEAGKPVYQTHAGKFKRFAGRLPATITNDPDYWRAKGIIE